MMEFIGITQQLLLEFFTKCITRLKYKNTYKKMHILTENTYEHNDHTINKVGMDN